MCPERSLRGVIADCSARARLKLLRTSDSIALEHPNRLSSACLRHLLYLLKEGASTGREKGCTFTFGGKGVAVLIYPLLLALHAVLL